MRIGITLLLFLIISNQNSFSEPLETYFNPNADMENGKLRITKKLLSSDRAAFQENIRYQIWTDIQTSNQFVSEDDNKKRIFIFLGLESDTTDNFSFTELDDKTTNYINGLRKKWANMIIDFAKEYVINEKVSSVKSKKDAGLLEKQIIDNNNEAVKIYFTYESILRAADIAESIAYNIIEDVQEFPALSEKERIEKLIEGFVIYHELNSIAINLIENQSFQDVANYLNEIKKRREYISDRIGAKQREVTEIDENIKLLEKDEKNLKYKEMRIRAKNEERKAAIDCIDSHEEIVAFLGSKDNEIKEIMNYYREGKENYLPILVSKKKLSESYIEGFKEVLITKSQGQFKIMGNYVDFLEKIAIRPLPFPKSVWIKKDNIIKSETELSIKNN